ncbi:MAG: hypothetical protein IT229_01090 [Flavobacteriales bacterium]|nr:hypothetical protein [Flavobacteriales bacterium]
MRLLPLALAAFIATTLNAQSPAWIETIVSTGWTETYAQAIDAQGNVYVCGYYDQGPMQFGGASLPYGPNQDAFVAKVDPTGDVVWMKRMGGTSFDRAYDVGVDATGNVYVTGFVDNDGAVQFGSLSYTPTAEQEAFLTKLSPTGTFLWVRHTEGTSITRATGIGLDVSAAGDVILCGNTDYGFTLGGTFYNGFTGDDMFLASYNTSGTLQWCHYIDGDVDDEEAVDVAFDGSGGFYFTGRARDEFDLGGLVVTPAGNFSPFVARLNAAGVPQWAVTLGSSNFQGDAITDLEVDSDTNVVISGYLYDGGAIDGDTLHTNAEYQAFLASISPAGTVNWSKYLAESSGLGGSRALGLGLAPDNTIFVCGSYYADTVTVGGTVHDNAGSTDLLLWNYSSGGDLQWHDATGGTYTEAGMDMIVSDYYAVYLTGYTYSIDLQLGTVPVANPNSIRQGFLAKYDPGAIGVPEISDAPALLLWPNPASDHLQVAWEPGDRYILRDLNGRTLAGSIVPSLAVGHLAPGMYIVEKRGREGSQMGRFLKL